MAASDGTSEANLPAELSNLRHLRLLDVAVREGSLTRAANLVHISQPAASQAIAKLAKVFGVRLLERVGNTVTPTEEGQIVVARARRALEHLRDLGPHARPRHDSARGGTRGGAADLLERYTSTSQLRAIATFATTGSFASAARRIGQTETSIQRACRNIEQIIGLPLIEGGQRNRSLTAPGRIVAAQASLALKELATARAELREREGVFDSRLVIGALPLARTRLVPEAVVKLMTRYPEARIEIIDGSYESLVQQLRFGTCDLIVGALRGPALPDGLREVALFQDKLSIVARKEHPLVGRRVTGAELRSFPWILPRSDAPARHMFEQLSAQHGLTDPSRGHVETGSLVVLRGILLESDALALISLRQIDYEYIQGLLVPLDFPIPDTERPIGITLLEKALPTRLHGAFLEYLEDASEEKRPN